MPTTDTSTVDLDAIRKRADAATPGPWEAYDANEGLPRPLWSVANDAFHNPPADEDAPWIAVDIHVGGKEDAEFIAAVREDVPTLLAEIDRLRAELAKENRAHSRTIEERDRYHEAADNLAHAIAAMTGVEIGEHSSMNDPWQNALDVAEGWTRAGAR